MFGTRGRLGHIACPAHRDGLCVASRVHCPFSHDLSRVPKSASTEEIEQDVKAGLLRETKSTSTATATNVASASASGSSSQKRSAPSASAPSPDIPVKRPRTMVPRVGKEASKVPQPTRQASLKAFHDAYTSLYKCIIESPNPEAAEFGVTAAHDDAVAQEAETHKCSNQQSYKNSSRSALLGIRGRDKGKVEISLQEALKSGTFDPIVMRRCSELGTQADTGRKRLEVAIKGKGKLLVSKLQEKQFLCPIPALEMWGYLTALPEGEGGDRPDSTGERQKCERCGVAFIVAKPGNEPVCFFHHGRKRPDKGPEGRKWLWTCCGAEVGLDKVTCSSSHCHVFKEDSPADLHARSPFVIPDLPESGGHEVLALDCELSYTTAGMSLVQLSIVSEEGDVMADMMVKPDVDVLDYNTRFSGVSAADFEGRVYTLSEARDKLRSLMRKDTVLIGHGLENDLKALRLVYTSIVDTVMLFPHPRGPPYRMSLRELTSNHLGRIIQASGSEGHTASIDATMALDLVRWKLIHESALSPFRNPISKWFGAAQQQQQPPAQTTLSQQVQRTSLVSDKARAAISAPKRR